MAVPYTFGSATSSIPLSQLDSNFATGITLGNTTVYLGNTTTSFGNVTLTNVTISSVSTAITPSQGGTGLVTIPANNVILGNGTSNVTVVAPGTSGNVLTSNGTTWSSSTISAASVSAAGSTTQVQYNNGGAFAGSANLTFNGTTLTAAGLSGPHDGTVGATTPNTGSFTTLAASSTVSGTGFSTYLASPPAIGSTAANTGAFTTLTTSSTVTLNGGTANGVTYLNGSKVLTSGSALTYNGTGLGVGSANPGRLLVLDGGASGPTLQMTNTAAGSSAGNGLEITFDGTNTFLNNRPNGYMWFGVNATEQMRLTSTGLGIGTSSPSAKLTLVGNTFRHNDATGSYGYTINATSNTTTLATLFGGSSFAIQTGASGSNQFLLDSAGNLGLGVTPSAWSGLKAFQINSQTSLSADGTSTQLSTNAYYGSGGWTYIATGYASNYYQTSGTHVWRTAASSSGAISWTSAMTLDASGNLVVGYTSALNTASGRGNITVNGSSSSIFVLGVGNAQAGYFYSDGTNSIVANEGTGYLSFRTNSAERARIDSSGNFTVGNTTGSSLAQQGINLVGGIAASQIYVGHASGVASGQTYMAFTYNAATIGSITQSGTTAVLYNVTSDQRLKENIVDAPEFGSVIDSIKVRSYDWKADGNHQRAGFIAQELVTVAPEAVHQPADDEQMMAVDYSKLVPMLVKEIQSLRQRVAQLETN